MKIIILSDASTGTNVVYWPLCSASSFFGVGLHPLSLEHLIDSLEYRSFDLQLFGLSVELIMLLSSVDLHLSAYLRLGRLLPEPILELLRLKMASLLGSSWPG